VGAVEPAVCAGDCVIFENRTWHAGGRNMLGSTRKAVMIGYTYTWVQPSDYERQSDATRAAAAARYGDIGLQLVGGLPQPHHFDYDYDTKPLCDWAAAEGHAEVAG
jgi:ectoine hydroxylase-related dioxygenase (phytanoyl-CoA dioxygenase family)